MQPAIQNVYVVYGSVSGNAQELAAQLFSDSELTQRFEITLQELDEFEPSNLTTDSFVAFISSSFGDGEPPSNAENFWQIFQESTASLSFSYGVFGLGDTAYSNFCGFSKNLDDALSTRGAERLINRVDSDLNYPALFETWKSTLKAVLLNNDLQAGKDLDISVTSYGEHSAYPASLVSASQISGTFPSLYRIHLSIEGSGIRYQPGDIVHLMLRNTESLLMPYADFFGLPVGEVETCLKDKEIARISKSAIRKVTQRFPNSDLKALLKNRNKVALMEYVKRHQFIDLLRDFYPPQTMSIMDFSELLNSVEPRTYSIASSQLANADALELCVREVWSDPENAEPTPGCSTAYLQSLNVGDSIPIFVRSNPHFHFDFNAPSILIATGAGIAPFIGYLQSRAQQKALAPCILFYGEKHEGEDYVYRDEIAHWLKTGVLQNCFVAFSRDQESKRYVQDSVKEQGDLVQNLIYQGANVYVCGRKQNLASQIEPMFNALQTIESSSSEANFYNKLVAEEKLHLDLF